jgi:hypothetical protein
VDRFGFQNSCCNVAAMDINTIVTDFAKQLSALIETEAVARARTAVLAAFGDAPRRGPGRPPKSTAPAALAVAAVKRARKKGPPQLCPVPGCKSPAAPVFGMVCAKHKDLPMAKIKAFREARKAKKLKAEGVAVPKKRGRKPGRPKSAKAPKVAKKGGRKPGHKPTASAATPAK